MTTNMRKAIEAAGLGGRGDFLDRFKAFGWYLDDLALTPVNDLPPSQREMECLGAQKSLAARIAEYNPRAIVPLLLGIKDIVKAAADDAGNTAPHYPVPFPGQGNQERFQEEMKHILPKLPREPA